MTASRLGLAILTAIALGLGVVVALDRPPAAVPRSARLLPDLDPDRLEAVRIERGDETVTLARGDAGWTVESPVPGPADPSAVADLLGALELASAERWLSGAIDARVVVIATDRAGVDWRLAIGGEAPGGLVHAEAAGRAALVEAWVARALDRGLADLRRRAVVPFSPPTGIELHAGGVDLVASRIPLRAHLPSGTFRLAPARAGALVDALAALRFVSLPAGAPPEPVGTLRLLGGPAPLELDDAGPCPGAPADRWLTGSAGSGCVAGATWNALLDAARAITADPVGSIDPSPITSAPVTRVTLLDGAVLERQGGGWALGDLDADDAAVATLLAALRAPGRVVDPPPRAAGTITVVHGDGTTVALELAGTVVRRADEPHAIEIAPELAARLRRGALAVADRVLLAAEPSLLRTITAGDTALTMGATFSDWTATRGTPDLAAIDAVRELVASLEADELLPGATVTPVRTLTIGFDPPPSPDAEPTTHTIAVARPSADGRCRARVDTTTALLPAEACAILLAPLSR